jgi:hypothetical protein
MKNWALEALLTQIYEQVPWQAASKSGQMKVTKRAGDFTSDPARASMRASLVRREDHPGELVREHVQWALGG